MHIFIESSRQTANTVRWWRGLTKTRATSPNRLVNRKIDIALGNAFNCVVGRYFYTDQDLVHSFRCSGLIGSVEIGLPYRQPWSWRTIVVSQRHITEQAE